MDVGFATKIARGVIDSAASVSGLTVTDRASEYKYSFALEGVFAVLAGRAYTLKLEIWVSRGPS